MLKYFNNNDNCHQQDPRKVASQNLTDRNDGFSSDDSNGGDRDSVMMPTVAATDEEDNDDDVDDDHQSDYGLYENGEALNKLVDEF